MRKVKVIIKRTRNVVQRDTPVALHLPRDIPRRLRRTGEDIKLLTCVVIYQMPDYTKPDEVYKSPPVRNESRLDAYQLIYRPRPDGRGKRKFELLVEKVNVSAATNHIEDGNHEIRLTTPPGGRTSPAYIPIRPFERERVYLDFDSSSADVLLVNRNRVPIELGWRWCPPEVKIQEFLEFQYTCIYGAQKSGEGTTNAIVVKPHWDRHLKSGNVMTSRSGNYLPGAVCVTFVNIFLTYWSNFGRPRNNQWYLASNMAAIENRFSDVLEPSERMSWPELLERAGTATTDLTDIYFCGSGGHVWLLMPLGGVFQTKKKYIFGFGLDWELENQATPTFPGWYEHKCELGWYLIHASGPGVKPSKKGRKHLGVPSWSTVFTGPGGLTQQQLEYGIIEGLEEKGSQLSRPIPSSVGAGDFPWDARYSVTETYQDLADNLKERMNDMADQERFSIFSGTPLTWMNARIWRVDEETVQKAETLDQHGKEIVRSVKTMKTMTRKKKKGKKVKNTVPIRFQVRKLRNILNDSNGWSSLAGWEESRDVRPIIWKDIV